VGLQAQIWKDVWVPRSTLARGDVLRELQRERRDVLNIREPLFDPPPLRSGAAGPPPPATAGSGTAGPPELGAGWELAQAVSPGMPLLQRYVRLRPVVHRGQVVDAQLRDGPLLISMKVEVLENGAPGELIRVRNPKTRHEFRGKVSDEQTILVAL
jgi:flagella basal body P-ring formation protein FlgA